jgi:hypothetical protein
MAAGAISFRTKDGKIIKTYWGKGAKYVAPFYLQ